MSIKGRFIIEGEEVGFELYEEIAPITVKNFVDLVKRGFYNGLTFHRVIKDFMIQGGCPDGTGAGGPGYTILGEFNSNGVLNNLKHTPGVLSMARSTAPNSAGSQFFIMTSNSPHLDGEYAGFGKVISNYKLIEDIASRPVGRRDYPLKDIHIEKVEIL
ncbi:MAG: peptidylprolyl isomerase [Bacillales bacterium]|nr:peptidylprolyl isomerase [Bacillales bacterium]